jgi:AbiV family abortive infection protein
VASFCYVVPIPELAKGHCLAVANARRLIVEGELLLKSGGYLSAINQFRLAVEELAKAHLISQASTFKETDTEKWKWFWAAFNDHREKLRIIEYEFHWESYRDREEFNRRISVLRNSREKVLYVDFDRANKKFSSPDQHLADPGTMAVLDHQYVLKIYELFTVAGMPEAHIMEDVYNRNYRQFNGLADSEELITKPPDEF